MVNIIIQHIILGFIAIFHPFYISVVDILHNPKESAVEISVRIFTEDLEKNLKKYTTQKIDFNNPGDKKVLDKEINHYLSQHLQLIINGQSVKLQYLGFEIQKESIWTYYEVEKIKEINNLEILCSILYDFDKSQSNIFHVKSKGIEKSTKLDNPKNIAIFSF